MTAKQKVAVISAAAFVAIGAPAYVQHRQLKRLQAELSALRPPPGTTAPAVEIRRLQGEVARLTVETRQAESPAALVASEAEVARLTETVRKQPEDLSTRSNRLASTRSRAIASGASDGVSSLAEAGAVTLSSLDLTDATAANGKLQWDHGQATGVPDTTAAGDLPTAWAPLRPKSGEQWLQLGYENAVELKEINIHESHNPGAVSRVAAIMPDGSERNLWQGTANRGGNELIESSVPIPPGTTARQIKVYVDTNRVESWPEIDAVEMVGTDGSRQWATESSASSSYSENYSQASTR